MFQALAKPNYRIWAASALISNIGIWMQRISQDWLLLTHLTHHDAVAVGIASALQFGPQVVLLPLAGGAVDRVDRRRLLMATQVAMGLLALALGLLVLGGDPKVWQVESFALLLGCVSAVDAPARQVFVGELVGYDMIANAVALNSASFSAGRLIGPAVAGLLIAAVGIGQVFLLNAVAFLGVLGALGCLRRDQLFVESRSHKGGLIEAIQYVRSRPDLFVNLLMTCLMGTFAFNFPVVISAMAASVFHAGASRYGLLSSALACGTIVAALLAARRSEPGIRMLIVSCFVFSVFSILAALAPEMVLFGVFLIPLGWAAQTFTTSSSTLIQLHCSTSMRGRVVALRLAVSIGGAPIGAPLVGLISNHYGARWGLFVGTAASLCAAALGLWSATGSRQCTPATQARPERI